MKKIVGSLLGIILTASIAVSAAPVDMQIDVTNSVSKLTALRTDGTINIHGYNLINNSEIESLSGVKAIACEDFDENSFFTLMEDGTVREFYKFKRTEFSAVSEWNDIVSIDGGNGFLVGLKADGTIVLTGSNASTYKNALSWQNISSIYAKEDCLTAITTDGKVLVTGIVGTLDKKIKDWSNMKKVVFDTRNFWGLTNDGEIISTDTRYKLPRIPNSELICDIEDFEVMSAFYSRIIFLKKDGTLYEMESYTTSNGSFKLKKLYDNVHSLTSGGIYFAAVLKDGEIVSDKLSLSSDKWILGIDIRVDGKFVDCDVQPYIKNERTMVPIRAISEALGAEVGYDDATKTAIISKDGKIVKVTMDSNSAFVDDNELVLDAPAENVDGRIFVPVRFVSEGLGCNVEWIGETKSVMIK